MAAYATFEDLTTVYEGTIASTDRSRLEALLLRASKRLDRLVPSLAHRLGTGDLDPELPSGLVVEAVLRVYRNPEGVTQDQMGPFSKQFNPRGVKAEIAFDTDEVHALLDPIAPIPSSFRVGEPLSTDVEKVLEGFSDVPVGSLGNNLPVL